MERNIWLEIVTFSYNQERLHSLRNVFSSCLPFPYIIFIWKGGWSPGLEVNLAMDYVNYPGFLSLSLDLALFIIYRTLKGKKITSTHCLSIK